VSAPAKGLDAESAKAAERVATLLARARSVLFVTGAGISADSGLPTYRGIGGLYEDAGTEDGIPIEDALSGETMTRDPALCWKYIAQIERACRGARANRGHEVLAEMERRISRAWVLTQNVDGFHLDAGSRNVIEIHGNVRTLVCTRCARTRTVPDYTGLTIPPACDACGALVRPAVVLFGEMLPAPAIAVLERELAQGFDLVVSIGTTAVFPYIAGPVAMARAAGVPTAEINPGRSAVSDLVDHRIVARAALALDAIWRRLSP